MVREGTSKDVIGAFPQLSPRGLSREQAAAYVGIGTTLFDKLVATGRMPKPLHVDGRRIWDRRALDQYFDARAQAKASIPWNDVED